MKRLKFSKVFNIEGLDYVCSKGVNYPFVYEVNYAFVNYLLSYKYDLSYKVIRAIIFYNFSQKTFTEFYNFIGKNISKSCIDRGRLFVHFIKENDKYTHIVLLIKYLDGYVVFKIFH